MVNLYVQHKKPYICIAIRQVFFYYLVYEYLARKIWGLDEQKIKMEKVNFIFQVGNDLVGILNSEKIELAQK